MARGIGMEKDAEVFRGVVVMEREGEQSTHYFGPYDKKGTAGGVATQKANAMKRWWGRPVIVDKYVERANVQWERVA